MDSSSDDRQKCNNNAQTHLMLDHYRDVRLKINKLGRLKDDDLSDKDEWQKLDCDQKMRRVIKTRHQRAELAQYRDKVEFVDANKKSRSAVPAKENVVLPSDNVGKSPGDAERSEIGGSHS